MRAQYMLARLSNAMVNHDYALSVAGNARRSKCFREGIADNVIVVRAEKQR
jgi:hypothetical protein